MDVRIGKGTLSELETIAGFQIAMALESEGTVLQLETVLKGVRAVLEDSSKGVYFVARGGDDTVLGSLLVTREWSDWNNCDYWWVQSVFVRPEYRGRGVFAAMYAEVRRIAGESGSPCLRLYVDKANLRAQETYRKLGMDECHYLMYEERI